MHRVKIILAFTLCSGLWRKGDPGKEAFAASGYLGPHINRNEGNFHLVKAAKERVGSRNDSNSAAFRVIWNWRSSGLHKVDVKFAIENTHVGANF